MELALCGRCGGQAIEGVCLRCLCAAEPAPIAIPGIELGEEIGRGGSATVYAGHRIDAAPGQARRGADDGAIAVKVFAGEVEQDGVAVARFHREAVLLQSLPHPNILGVEGWGEVDGRHYIITELAAGGPISDRIPLEPTAAVAVVQQVCAALVFAHAHGIVHRDVKPQNVLVAADGTIKLGDFGTARQLATSNPRVTETGDVVGTPYYMAPEAMHGAPHDPRMDVYAVGVLLYHLVTGTLPIGYFEPLPGALDPVVRRALAHNPELRYSTIAELSLDLVRATSQPPRTTARGRWRGPLALAGFASVAGAYWAWGGAASDRETSTRAATLTNDRSIQYDASQVAHIERGVGDEPEPGRSSASQTGGRGPQGARDEPGPSRRGSATEKPVVDSGSIRRDAPHPQRGVVVEASAASRAPQKATPRDRHEPHRSAPPVTLADGAIAIVVRPWAEVQIDGVSHGRAEPPTARFRVAAGEHTVVLSHPITGVQTTRRVRVESNGVVEIRADLGRTAGEAP